MSIMTRFVRLWKADVHGVMDQMEDRQLLLRQNLREMEEELERQAALFGRMSAARDRARQEGEKNAKESARLTRDIDTAVQKDKEEIARQLIRKRLLLDKHLVELQRHLEEMDKKIVTLTEHLAERQRQYEEIRLRSACYLREQAIEAGQHDVPFPLRPDLGVTDEEVELELLKRKDSVVPNQGGPTS
ncbi:MAG: hypothetical protein A2521_16485 [Deltaproteobacteria bacterium RIFOXYD12_FULL_57_12]|nr:MAG: hypothetical protein A2521_16485 [Deltaproteobacteria bacterium RIFOXYD12_FULL_57_12]